MKVSLSQTLLAGLVLAILPAGGHAQPAKPKPCSSQHYRQFDFWLGQWQVFDPKGKLVGHSHIQSIVNGCGISEAWTGAKGYQGVSYNFYDNKRQLWHQTWIGGGGGALYLDGGLEDKRMVLQGKDSDKDGKPLLQKISWTPLEDGRVKQHWQTSKDEGKTWSDAFVGYYQKKSQGKAKP